MINTKEDVEKFINDSSLKKIFVLCGEKSFVSSGAKLYTDKILLNRLLRLKIIMSI